MQINSRPVVQRTYEGAPAKVFSPIQELRRAVLACLLWEDQFYENGQSISERITDLVKRCDPNDVSALAIEARTKHHIRHASLLLARELCRHPQASGRLVGDTIFGAIQRADELAELIAMYWMEKKQPLTKQIKVGLQRAFGKFDEYQLAKYNRDKAIKLLDVMRLVHPRPKNDEQSALWKRLRDGELKTPDTWEVALSSGADKKETFTRLLQEKKLGYLALLRNLRNMMAANVDQSLIRSALLTGAERSKALPFRFVAAAQATPGLEDTLDKAMTLACQSLPKIPGKTILLVDVSGSMVGTKISKRSELDRLDAAAALAVLVDAVSEECEIYTFSHRVSRMPTRHGMALMDAIKKMDNGATYLGEAIRSISNVARDRLIVLTDEQSHDRVDAAKEGKNYMINVASYKNGVGYGDWIRVDGFSEAVIHWIQEYEAMMV